MKNVFHALIELVFPKLCIMCFQEHPVQGSHFCLQCKREMPYTPDFKSNTTTMSERRIRGRIQVEHAVALYNFYEHSMIRSMIHKIKYQGRKDIAVVLGQMLGHRIKESNRFRDLDLLLPVPLYKLKKKQRGFNQSYYISKGIQDVLSIPIRTDLVSKVVNTASQTSKGRLARVRNVEDSFHCILDMTINDKHILIVDDVLTTGATIEGMVNKISKKLTPKISVATLCVAVS